MSKKHARPPPRPLLPGAFLSIKNLVILFTEFVIQTGHDAVVSPLREEDHRLVKYFLALP